MCLNAALQSLSNFIRCPYKIKNPKTSKEENCRGGQEHNGGQENPLVRCCNCGQDYCFNHKMPYHEDYTCEEWDRFIAGDSAETSMLARERRIMEDFESRQRGDSAMARRIELEQRNDIASNLNDVRAQAQVRVAKQELERENERRRQEEQRKQSERETENFNRDKEARRRREDNSKSEQFVTMETRQCPKCKSPIEKVEGCNHMECRGKDPKSPTGFCQTQFCWECRYIFQHGGLAVGEFCHCFPYRRMTFNRMGPGGNTRNW